jgi:hypothetical protein
MNKKLNKIKDSSEKNIFSFAKTPGSLKRIGLSYSNPFILSEHFQYEKDCLRGGIQVSRCAWGMALQGCTQAQPETPGK